MVSTPSLPHTNAHTTPASAANQVANDNARHQLLTTQRVLQPQQQQQMLEQSHQQHSAAQSDGPVPTTQTHARSTPPKEQLKQPSSIPDGQHAPRQQQRLLAQHNLAQQPLPAPKHAESSYASAVPLPHGSVSTHFFIRCVFCSFRFSTLETSWPHVLLLLYVLLCVAATRRPQGATRPTPSTSSSSGWASRRGTTTGPPTSPRRAC